MENKLQFIDNNALLTINSDNDGEIVRIEGRACTYNKANMNGEIVDANSFRQTLELFRAKQLKPALTYNHDNVLLLGGIDNIESRADGLYMEAHLNNDIALCKDTIIPCVKSKDINTLSTEGYIVDGYNGIREYDDGTYYVKNFLLTAVSIVPVPADPRAIFTVKNFLSKIKQNKKIYYHFL